MADAIVVGQGASGLTAALTLARQGMKVISISKVRPGGATCTIYAGGGFTLGIEGVTPKEHKAMTLETGRRLNQPDLLDVFSLEAPSIVETLESIGVNFIKRRGGLSIVRNPAFPLLGGKPLIDRLYHACVEAGVEFRQNLIVSRILTDDRGVTGLECVDYQSFAVEIIRAKAVVLATGGAGALYPITDNPQRITGDGYRLAFSAGCPLLDMEFVQFYPIGIAIPGGAHWFIDLSIIDRARVTNSRGEEFLKAMLLNEGIDSGRQANLLARDKCSVAISLAEKEGPVLLHLEDVGKAAFEKDPYLQTIAKMFPKSSPPWAGPVRVHPIQHYFPGGVAISPSGETNLPGLYAAGEVTGGVDGANRVGGNALTNCLLFGRKAGMSAASHLTSSIMSNSADGSRIGSTSNPTNSLMDSQTGCRADGSLSRPARNCATQSSISELSLDLPDERSAEKWLETWQEGTIRPDTLRKDLQVLSSQYLMPLRDGDGLFACLKALEEKRALLGQQSIKDYKDILLAFENLGLWYTALFVTMGAYIRKESRGAHFRSDYPNEREEWGKHIHIQSSRGKITSTVV